MSTRATGFVHLRAALALLAAAALTLSLIAAPGAAGGDGSGEAVAAKKKCKKGKKSASAAKKKCKKGKSNPGGAVPTTPPAPTGPPAPTPVQRALLSWDDNADLDLCVWDTSLVQACDSFGSISSTFHSVTSSVGPVAFFDRLNPSTRHFAFGVCMVAEPFADPSNMTLTAVRGDGVAETFTHSIFDAGGSFLFVPPGAADPDPANTGQWCKDIAP